MRKAYGKLGKNFRKLRKAQGFTQKEIARLSQISTTYYAGIERGEENPTLFVVKRICKALDIKII